MKEFNSTKLEKQNVNGGKQFTNGQILSADDLNPIVEGILYNNENCSDEIVVDTELNENSENPVQNKVIAKEIKELKEKSPENVGTTVTVGGQAVETFDADTKVDKWTPDKSGYNTILLQTGAGGFTPLKVSYGTPVNGAVSAYSSRGSGNNVLGTGTPVDDTDCANKQYVDDIAETKLDKATGLSQYNKAYIKTTAGEQQLFDVADGNVGNAIVRRKSDAQIYVPVEPNSPNSATSKKYVEEAVANAGGGKLYLHRIAIYSEAYTDTQAGREMEIYFSVYSTKSTAFTIGELIDIYYNTYVYGTGAFIGGQLISGAIRFEADTNIRRIEFVMDTETRYFSESTSTMYGYQPREI